MRQRTSTIICISLLLAATAMAQSPKKLTRAEAMSAVTSKVQPEYPPVARQLKLEGVVELEISITEGGQVDTVSIVSGNPVLTKPAADAVRKWKFAPQMQDGKPARAVAPVTLAFKL